MLQRAIASASVASNIKVTTPYRAYEVVVVVIHRIPHTPARRRNLYNTVHWLEEATPKILIATILNETFHPLENVFFWPLQKLETVALNTNEQPLK